MTEQEGQPMTHTSYVAESKSGNAVKSFDTLQGALAFRDKRKNQGVTIHLFKVTTIKQVVEA